MFHKCNYLIWIISETSSNYVIQNLDSINTDDFDTTATWLDKIGVTCDPIDIVQWVSIRAVKKKKLFNFAWVSEKYVPFSNTKICLFWKIFLDEI